MGRRAGWSVEDTRRVVLEAAAEVFSTKGAGATLAEIAKRAGMAKGVLAYHFANKQALIHDLIANLLDDFRDLVLADVDPEDDRPGRLTRAYIRTSLGAAAEAGPQDSGHVLIAQLIADPDVAALVAADSARWRELLDSDGLPPSLLTLIIAATDGINTGPIWGVRLTAADLEPVRDRLLALTSDVD